MVLDVAELKKRIISLLKEDEEFRLVVVGLLGLDNVLLELKKLREDFNKFIELEEKRWEENSKKWEENNRRWEENNKRWEEAYKRFEAIEMELKNLREETKRLREDFNKLYESVMRRMDLFEMRMNAFERRVIALGTRWGLESEKAFRNAMKGVIEKILGMVKVEKWRYFDETGEVLGYPAWIEADIAVKDQIHVVIEIKASASDGDVAKLWRIGNLYMRVTGVKPRLAIVTPFIDEKGLEVAKRLGVEVYTST